MKLSILFIFALIFFTSCSLDTNMNGEYSDGLFTPDMHINKKDKKVPFKAKFYSVKTETEEYEDYCTSTPQWPGPNYQTGNRCGTATHLGLISVDIIFCGGPAGEDGKAPYGNGFGKLIASNGDELHFFIEEGFVQIDPGFEPPYDAHFQTPFIISGGTGKFTNASGSGVTDSKVDLFDENGYIEKHRTDHIFTGIMTF
jgi:hypothetical protein